MPALTTRLVSAPVAAALPRIWPAHVQALIDGEFSAAGGFLPYRVHGGPGTGKTSLIVDIAVARLSDPDTDPESILVLAASRRAATELREQITARLLSTGTGPARTPKATREPIVRTLHSYAFAVLRLQAAAHDNPPPRLITGAEQDAVLRELLAGDIEDGAEYWPERLRPALGTNGFAQALRDIMMRAAERGVGPEDLIALGRTHRRPEWQAAGRAYRQYEQSGLLRGAVGLEAPQATAPAVDAAELVGSALTAFATDPDLLRSERARVRYLLVDDAQHLDPQAATLIRLVGAGTHQAVVAGDGDQSIFGFRGASARFLDELDDPARDILLDNNFRSTAPISDLTGSIAARLPGRRRHRLSKELERADHRDAPAPVVRIYGSAAKEATAIADMMRRAHLYDDVPWSRMAVIVRSVPRAMAPLRRALRSAGVPVMTPASEIPLALARSVSAMLLALRAVEMPLDPDSALELLSGPIGGADPAALRRLRRGVRRIETESGRDRDSATVIAELVSARPTDIGEPAIDIDRHLDGLTDAEKQPLVRVLAVIRAARTASESRRSIEEILWEAWQATGLGPRWSNQVMRRDHGPGGAQADRDLDAMVALFDAAANFADSLPAATLGGFIDYLSALQIPTESRMAQASSDSVTVLSAHAAAGREWDVVAVAGVQDGLWPSLRSRGSILGTGQLVDLLDGVAAEAIDTISRTAVALAEERRLLLVACSRARLRLMVSAVDDGSGDAAPSRFVGELAAVVAGSGEADEPELELPVEPGLRRVLSLSSLVAELRAQVCAGTDEDDPRTRAAADMLAELADAGVAGAHPDEWYGLAGPSTTEPLWSEASGPLTLSPSSVESLGACSLRWMLERYGGRDGDSRPAVAGTLVHTLVQAVAGKIPPEDVTASLRRVWDQVDVGAPWFSRRELERTEEMLTNFRQWLRMSREGMTEVGVEIDVNARVEPAQMVDADGEVLAIPEVRLRGRIDRLEADSKGRPVVVDVKTGKNTISVAAGQEHAQLATYQLALTLGGVPELGNVEPGGGALVYVNSANGKTGAAQRNQDPLNEAQVDQWLAVVRSAAYRSIGPGFEATVNDGCGHCALKSSCPSQLEGRMVTDG
ncbi:ATP-dependent DNA helicase [Nocardia sp. 348MFTsu5.1]|uniref:ATP-dependent helicase n=1 Tax=Nocardia sp. 348MFTsu5.1 TaxID=1172185 RepID=UPI00036754B7|nr:ATP-dependent DNA helicase [Nocardia sp. 348MFTsu5.1]